MCRDRCNNVATLNNILRARILMGHSIAAVSAQFCLYWTAGLAEGKEFSTVVALIRVVVVAVIAQTLARMHTLTRQAGSHSLCTSVCTSSRVSACMRGTGERVPRLLAVAP